MMKKIVVLIVFCTIALGLSANIPQWLVGQLDQALSFDKGLGRPIEYTLNTRTASNGDGEVPEIVLREFKVNMDKDGNQDRTMLAASRDGVDISNEAQEERGDQDFKFYPPNREYYRNYSFKIVKRQGDITEYEYKAKDKYSGWEGYGVGTISVNESSNELIGFTYTPYVMPFGLSRFTIKVRYETFESYVIPVYSLLSLKVDVIFFKKNIESESFMKNIEIK